MPFVKLRSNLLLARDQRQQHLDDIIKGNDETLIVLSLNIPGADKVPHRVNDLFRWGDQRIRDLFPYLLEQYRGCDHLGPWSIYATTLPGREVKYHCCEIEEDSPFARLLDIDVYASSGRLIDRSLLQLSQRKCLICSSAAKECMRLKRHTPEEINARLHKLLASIPD